MSTASRRAASSAWAREATRSALTASSGRCLACGRGWRSRPVDGREAPVSPVCGRCRERAGKTEAERQRERGGVQHSTPFGGRW